MATVYFKRSKSNPDPKGVKRAGPGRGSWAIKYKDIDGEWKSYDCGVNASKDNADAVKKKYDSIELNHRHKMPVRVLKIEIPEALKDFRDIEADI